jgi:hypothetical protein
MLNDKSSTTRVRWQLGIVAGIFLAVFSLYPQFKMWYTRGNDWQGAYAYNDIDEPAYASYLRALIDGRPRKNDPYTGRDDSAETPQPESLFSIQFVAPYIVAIPARALGLSASTAMTVSGALAAFAAAFIVFLFLARVTGNSLFAMAGALAVLCGGALAAGEGAFSELYNGWEYGAYPYFPFLRRYLPAIPFPFFFALGASMWALANTGANTGANAGANTGKFKKQLLLIFLAAVCFFVMVFSYFYIWTSAAAWLGVLGILWLTFRPENWKTDIRNFAILGALCAAILGCYAWLLSHRGETMDKVQLLVLTHAPDLWRPPELLSYLVLALLIISCAFEIIKIRDRATVFAFSFALVPLITFNQQVLTGRSLQPIHYQVFIVNYVAAFSAVFALGIFFKDSFEKYRKTSAAVISIFALLAIGWGFVECHYTVRVLDDANLMRDESMPVARRLEELAKTDEPSPDANRAVVLPWNLLQGDDETTVAPQAVLWARHQHVFAGVTWDENKERYYQMLYYMNLDEKWLDYQLKNGNFVAMIALFGWGRHTDRLSSEAKPLTYSEIREEVQKFAEYRKNFDYEKATHPTLSYLVAPTNEELDFTNLDKWYMHDEGEVLGKYILYKLKIRPEAMCGCPIE